jgi:hypothetical protein
MILLKMEKPGRGSGRNDVKYMFFPAAATEKTSRGLRARGRFFFR